MINEERLIKILQKETGNLGINKSSMITIERLAMILNGLETTHNTDSLNSEDK